MKSITNIVGSASTLTVIILFCLSVIKAKKKNKSTLKEEKK